MKGRLKQELHRQLLKTEGFDLAQDRIALPNLAPAFFGHTGLPAATDSLAYEPVQRILAIATSDGRVKFVGRDGVECTAYTTTPTATRYIQFLPKKGALLRVTQDGDLQLWSLSTQKLIDNMPCADAVTSVAVMHNEPYVLLGCTSGNIQVVGLLSASHDLAEGAVEAQSMELQPYQVSVEDMKARGQALCMTSRSHAGQHRLLVLHEDTGIIIWDLRYECAVAIARQETAEATTGLLGATATCACWIGAQGICFAVGYSTSDICVFGIPQPVQQGPPMDQPLEANLLGKLRVTPEPEPAEGIEQLTYFPGGASGCPHNLLVLGGQMLEMPSALTILPLECLMQGPTQDQQSHNFQSHSIPWFGGVQGWAQVPPEASINEYEDPAAIMVLTEGGQLMVHDLNTFQPVPVSLPFQELQAVTDSCLVASATEQRPNGGLQPAVRPHSLTLQRLRALKGVSLAAATGTASKWRWVFSGGRPAQQVELPPGSSDLYFTGHEDGRVRVWDVTGNVPALLATVPFDSGGPGVRLRPVSCLQVDAAAGVLVVGHKQGEARVYQFSQEEQDAVYVELDSKSPAEHLPRRQPAGFQCILQCTHHAATISSIAVASRLKLLALADEVGCVSLVDLSQPSISFLQQLAQQAMVSMQFAQQLIPAPAERAKSIDRHSPSKQAPTEMDLQTRPALFLCQANGSLATLEVSNNAFLHHPAWVHPKNRSQAINMILLAGDGTPLYPQGTHLHLKWPHNNMLTAEPQSNVQHQGVLGMDHVAEPLSPVGRHDVEGASLRHAGHAADDALSNRSARDCSQANSETDQSDSEEEDYLAAAVAASEAKDRKAKKVKHPHLRALRSKLGSIRGKDSQQPLASASSDQSSSTQEEAQQTSTSGPLDPVKTALSRLGLARDAPASPQSTADSAFEGQQSLSPHASAQHAQRTGPLAPAPPPEASQPPSTPPQRFLAEPDEEEAEEQAPVTHVLLCCDHSLRLYPAEGIRTGERSSAKKVNWHEPVGFTAAFNGPNGPGLVNIAHSADIGIWTLPGLEPLKALSLSSCLGFPWGWQGEASLLPCLQRMCSLAPNGLMALVGPCNEVVTLGLLTGLAPPAPPQGLYDKELSQASLAAAQAIADLQDKPEPWSGSTPQAHQDRQSEDAAAPESPSQGRAAAGARAGHLGAFFSQVRDAASKVVEEGGAGMANVSKTLALDRLGKRLPFGGGASPAHVSRPPPPTLQQLFSQTPQAESSGEIDRITDDEDNAAPHEGRAGASPALQKPQQQQTSPHTSPLAGLLGRHAAAESTPASSSGQEVEDSRSELLRGSRYLPDTKGKGSIRTADEIRSAYGRSGTRARDTRSIMADNMVALEDRGQKLQNIQDKSNQLEDGASDFASLAKELAHQQANRKWWQL